MRLTFRSVLLSLVLSALGLGLGSALQAQEITQGENLDFYVSEHWSDAIQLHEFYPISQITDYQLKFDQVAPIVQLQGQFHYLLVNGILRGVQYEAPVNFLGTDTGVYQISDDFGETGTMKLLFTVTDTAPVARPLGILLTTAQHNYVSNIQAGVSDPDGDPTFVFRMSAPSQPNIANLTFDFSTHQNNIIDIDPVAVGTTVSTITYSDSELSADSTFTTQVIDPTLTGTVAIDSAAGVETPFTGSLDGTGGIDKTGAGAIAFFAPSTYTGATTVSEGTLRVGASNVLPDASAVTIAAGATLDLVNYNTSDTIGSLAGAGQVLLGSASTLTVGADNTSTTFSGVISGDGNVTKIGTGTFTLNAVNTYTGTTTLNAGQLTLDYSALGSDAANLLVGSSTLAFGVGSSSTATLLLKNAVGGGATTQTFGSISTGIGTGYILADPAAGTTISLSTSTLTLGGTLIVGITNPAQENQFTFSAASSPSFASTGSAPVSLLYTLDGGADPANLFFTQLNDGVITRRAADLNPTGNYTGAADTAQIRLTTTGAGQTWTNPGDISASSGLLFVGADDYSINGGTLGGQLTTGNLMIATFGTGNLTLNSTLIDGSVSTQLTKSGSGILTLTAANTYTGGTTISAGTLAVSSGANLGSGPVLVTGSGQLSSGNSPLILNTDVSINSAFASLTSSNALEFGNAASGSLTVSDGGTVNASTHVGIGLATATASASVTGTGSTLTTGDLYIGATGGTGSLTIGDGGTVTANAVYFGYAGGSGTLDLDTGGTLATGGTDGISSPGTAQLNLAGGTVEVTGSALTTAVAATLSNTSTIDTNGLPALFSGNLSGDGSLNKIGTGTLTLSGTNTYTGGTTITGGLLNFSTLANLGTGTVTLNGGTLQWATGSTADVSSLLAPLGSAGGTFDTHGNDVTFASALSGSGALTKTGAGTLTLGMDNTYSNGTTITGGTLQLGNGGTTGSVNGDVLDNAALAFNHSDDVTFVGTISGTGSVIQDGTGTLILTRANTYTGGTLINAGTLLINDGQSLPGDVIDNGALVFNHSDDVTFAGNSTGTGTLTHTGNSLSTLTLTGNNTLTGGTTIRAGTLQIGDGGTTGTLTSDVINNGAFVFNRSDVATFSGNTSGTGTLTQAGAGTLILTGDNTATGGTTITSGTLQLGDGTTTGSLTGDIADNAALVVNRSDAVTLAGNISGTGTLTQAGAGVLTLTGSNTYAGGTNITGGLINFSTLANFGTGLVTLNGGGLQWATGSTVDVSSLLAPLGSAGGTFDTHGNDVILASVLSGPGVFTKTGTGTLILTGSDVISGGTLITGGTLQIGNNGTTGSLTGDIIDNAALVFDRSDSFAVSGNISGTGSLTKAGAGTLTLIYDNTHTGPTTISAGTLQLGAGGTAGSLIGDITNNGALVFDHSNDITYAGNSAGTGTLTQAGAGVLTLTGTNTYAGGTTITSGTLQLGDSTTTGSLIGAITDNAALVVNRSDAVTLAGTISGTGTLTQAGAGILTLTGSNTYAGGTTISDGTLAISSGSNLGTGAVHITGSGQLSGGNSIVILNTGVSIDSASAALTSANALEFGNAATGTLTVSDGGTVSASTYIGIGLATATASASVTGADSTLTTGDLYIGATGGNGILTIGDGGTVTATTVYFGYVGGGGTLNLNTGGTLATGGTNGISSPGTAHFNLAGGTVEVTGSVLTTAVAATLSNTSTIDTNGLSAAFTGALTGSGALVKTGAGSLNLTGTNTYSGPTTVNAGTLFVNGSLTQSALTVNTGATLGGSGTVGGLTTITSGGHLAPGNSPGTITFTAGLALNANSVLDFQLGSPTGMAGVDSDLIQVIGGTLSGPTTGKITLNLTDDGSFGAGTYTLIDYSTGGTLTSDLTADSFALGTTIAGYDYTFSLDGSTLELTATAIPEPTTYAMIFGALVLGFAAWRRRPARANAR